MYAGNPVLFPLVSNNRVGDKDHHYEWNGKLFELPQHGFARDSVFAIVESGPKHAVVRLIPDERPVIEQTLKELVDQAGCQLVLTTGGTGPALRDVTPEATLAVGDKEMPGFGEQMRQVSLKFVPTAILSRQVAVIRFRGADREPKTGALIINLPGQPKAIKETLEGLKDDAGKPVVNGIFGAVPYCIDLIGGPYIETNDVVVKAFRPKSALKKT
mgnify:CR=1 FL=1